MISHEMEVMQNEFFCKNWKIHFCAKKENAFLCKKYNIDVCTNTQFYRVHTHTLLWINTITAHYIFINFSTFAQKNAFSHICKKISFHIIAQKFIFQFSHKTLFSIFAQLFSLDLMRAKSNLIYFSIVT